MSLRVGIVGTGMSGPDHIRRLTLIAKRAKRALYEAPAAPA
jgi:hypothetical protein